MTEHWGTGWTMEDLFETSAHNSGKRYGCSGCYGVSKCIDRLVEIVE